MSVLNPVIDHLDSATKLIYLADGVRAYHPVTDLYHEIRHLRATDDAWQCYANPIAGGGAVPKGGGKYTPRYVIFQNGWRVVPEDVSHILDVTGEQLTDDGGSGSACFDFTVLSPGTQITVNYEPPAAEVIVIGGDMGAVTAAVAQVQATATLTRQLLQNRTHTDPATGLMTVYADDDATPLVTADLYEDTAATTPYSASSARIDRRDRLE